MLPMVVVLSFSDSSAIRYVLPVCVDGVIFSHNGANGTEPKMTRVFRPVRQVATPGRSLLSSTASC